MKKVCKINVDCPDCAAKVEKAVAAIDGVEKVTVSLMTQKMTVFADEGAMPAILLKAKKLVSEVDPDAVLYVE